MTQNFPNIITRSALFALSPVPEAAIEIGFIGENPDTLTALVERAKKIAHECDMVTDIRSNWGDKVPVWKPMFSQQKYSVYHPFPVSILHLLAILQRGNRNVPTSHHSECVRFAV